ncbi:MAG: Fur family transcriptional regulator, peroxide stress response regulator [Bacteroidales bacterium]|jgi:Fur family peroxide stress response transcriptional regulator|nr:Fur family transcriptional regulator, peroxide stress response regulator [Bacteroidales bacterium]MDN5329642.1 Fur family transcriptional regulator, peroxide stress response regulator [Bacteroidales bacterium]
MKDNPADIRKLLVEKGLKATPQRIAVYNALLDRHDHPTAEMLFTELLGQFPGLSVATVYNALDSLCRAGLVQRVKTEKGTQRYDAIQEPHHHLYCAASDRMEDYYDPDLDRLIQEYFDRKKIQGFRITDIKLQLTGFFEN